MAGRWGSSCSTCHIWRASTSDGCPGRGPGRPGAARPCIPAADRAVAVEALALDMMDARIECIVLKDRQSTYRDGSRARWYKVKDRGWYEREAWRFDRQ